MSVNEQKTVERRLRRAQHVQPEWSTMSGAEVEQLIVKLARDGKQPAVIGGILRDQHAVPDVRAATGKPVSQILAENGITPPVPDDLANLMRRSLALRGHLREHPRDTHNMRGLQMMESRVRRLVKYYKRTGRLPYEWKYSEATAKLLIE